MTVAPDAEARVRSLVGAARRIADAKDPIGIEARATLPPVTGLSSEGVEAALRDCLETDPTDGEIRALLGSVDAAPRALVLLSAHVFVGAHRAIALALSASDDVRVRPSRREPAMVELLARAAPGLFDVVAELAPSPGDAVWAYGSDRALEAFRASLPAAVTFHPHGTGIGAAVVDLRAPRMADIDDVARRVAHDVVLFDQRGCLSPRLVGVLGSDSATAAFASALASALEGAEGRIPRGRLLPDEAADATRYRDTLCVAGEVLSAGSGWVGVDLHDGPLVVPPSGRHVHVVRTHDAARTLAPLATVLTSIGLEGAPALGAELQGAFPWVRMASIGRMQSPAFDGAVDRRGKGIVTR